MGQRLCLWLRISLTLSDRLQTKASHFDEYQICKSFMPKWHTRSFFLFFFFFFCWWDYISATTDTILISLGSISDAIVWDMCTYWHTSPCTWSTKHYWKRCRHAAKLIFFNIQATTASVLFTSHHYTLLGLRLTQKLLPFLHRTGKDLKTVSEEPMSMWSSVVAYVNIIVRVKFLLQR